MSKDRSEPNPTIGQQELAERFGVSVPTVRRWTKEGTLPPWDVLHGQYRVPMWYREKLEAFLEVNPIEKGMQADRPRLDPAPPISEKGPPGAEPIQPKLEDLIVKLRRGPLKESEIAELTGKSRREVVGWLMEQQEGGMNLVSFGDHADRSWEVAKAQVPRTDAIMMEVMSAPDNTFLIGATGDSHLCSKQERLDVLCDLYDRYAESGITQVFHTGNWIEGEAPFNRHDIHVHGMEQQLDYLVKHYPRRPGIDTYAIAGDDHEGWYCQREGVDIGQYCEVKMRKAERADWHNLGYMEAYVKLVNRNSGQFAIMHLMHPGGGSAYAYSYSIQKIVESYGSGEKPAVLLAGHYHKMELVNIRNVWCVQTACTQDQTRYMRKGRLEAHVGGHKLSLKQDPKTGAIVEMNGMLRYFEAGYYSNRWSLSGPVTLPGRILGGYR
jgi:excisionase family DNA binding protein